MFEQKQVNHASEGLKLPSQREFAETLAAVNQLYTAMKGGVWGTGTDERSIFSALENKTPTQIASIKAIYKDRTGCELEQDLNSELSGNDLAKAKRLLTGTSSPSTTKTTNNDPDQSLPDNYQRNIQTALRENNIARANAFRLQYAMDGIGTNEEIIKQVLGEKTKAQIEAISSEYSNISGGRNLQNDLNSELGGRDQFIASESLKGSPTTAAEFVDRANRGIAFERSNAFSTRIMDTFSSRGAILESQNRRLNNFYQQSLADGTITDKEAQRVRELSGYANAEVRDYAQAKDTVTEGVAAAGATAAAAGAIALSGGLAAPAVAGALGYTATKTGMQGASYDGEGFVGDLAIGGVDGVLTAVTGGANQVVKGGFISQGAVAGGGGGIIRQAVNENTWQDGIADGLIKVAEGGFVGAAGGAVGGSVISGAKAVGGKLAGIAENTKVGDTTTVRVSEPTNLGETALKAPETSTIDNTASNSANTAKLQTSIPPADQPPLSLTALSQEQVSSVPKPGEVLDSLPRINQEQIQNLPTEQLIEAARAGYEQLERFVATYRDRIPPLAFHGTGSETPGSLDSILASKTLGKPDQQWCFVAAVPEQAPDTRVFTNDLINAAKTGVNYSRDTDGVLALTIRGTERDPRINHSMYTTMLEDDFNLSGPKHNSRNCVDGWGSCPGGIFAQEAPFPVSPGNLEGSLVGVTRWSEHPINTSSTGDRLREFLAEELRAQQVLADTLDKLGIDQTPAGSFTPGRNALEFSLSSPEHSADGNIVYRLRPGGKGIKVTADGFHFVSGEDVPFPYKNIRISPSK